MKLRLRKPRLGILALMFIIAALLAVTSSSYASRFVVMADSPDNVSSWNENNKGLNRECLEYINGQILALDPRPEMVFFLGDLVTRAHNAAGHRFIPDWKEVMKPLSLQGIKIYVAVGNRDLYGNTGWTEKNLEAEFRQYFSDPPHFDMPDNGPASYKKLAYSFSHGNAFFVVLDTFGFKPDGSNWDNGLDEEQLAWFSSQARGSAEKFKFAFSHGPAFSPEGWSVKDSVKKAMWGIMAGAKFDVYFCGHEHIYSRWVINKTVAPWTTRRIIQVLTGTAGAFPDHIFRVVKDRRTVHAFDIYNFVVADVNENDAQFTAYGIDWNAGNYSSRVIDRFAIQK